MRKEEFEAILSDGTGEVDVGRSRISFSCSRWSMMPGKKDCCLARKH